MRNRWGLVVLVAAVSFFSGGWLLQGASARPAVDGPQLFGDVLEYVSKYYVDSLKSDEIYEKASHGLVDELGDPYSALMEAEDYKQITEQTTGNYGGLGMQIDVRDGWITVVAPLPETPAERAGIEAGDQIVEVNGTVTRGLNQDDAVKTLRGTPGTRVDLRVRRPGMTELMPFALTRETIHYRSVQAGILFEGGIGLVALTPVIATSSDELRKEIDALRAKGMKGLIFDLRGNPGGLLTEGVAVSDLFLDRGQAIVSTRGRVAQMNQSYAAESQQAWPDLPVVVLVNEWSASAAELRKEIDALRAKGMKGLIFDLRGNPGGLLTEGVAVSDLFLDRGQAIVSTRGRVAQMNQSYAAESQQAWPDLPVVVLVNEWSASAAEIIAGALQDNDRALVLGTATFGKGLVQTLFPLGPDRALKLTTARWFTPSGRTIQREAKDQEAQVEQATAEASGRDSIKRVLPTFKTIGGRTVKGGGGIVPDQIVRGDSLTDGEKEFAKALGGNVTAYRDALVAAALEVKEKKLVTAEGFVVTDAMRQMVLGRLAAKNVALDPKQLAGGTSLLTDQLAYEISRYVFGRQAEIRRRSSDDPQVRAALELLRTSPTPKALMAKTPGE